MSRCLQRTRYIKKKKKKIQIVPFSLQKVKFLQDKCKTKSVSVSISISTYLSFYLQNHCRRWLQPWNQKTIVSWQESDDKLRHCVENRVIILPTKVHLVKAMVFPVVMCGCESWTLKKAEYQKIDTFELWCCRGLLKIPWTARRSNQSI